MVPNSYSEPSEIEAAILRSGRQQQHHSKGGPPPPQRGVMRPGNFGFYGKV